VAKVKVEQNGSWRVLKVWCVGDIGSADRRDPINAHNQAEGSIVDGISEMHQEITFDKGRTAQDRLLTDVPLLRMDYAPADRRALPRHQQPAHRPRRAGPYRPGSPGGGQRHLRRDGQAYADPSGHAEGHQLDLIFSLARNHRTGPEPRSRADSSVTACPYVTNKFLSTVALPLLARQRHLAKL